MQSIFKGSSYLQQFVDELFGQRSNFWWDVVLIVFDPLVSVFESLSFERWLADQQCVENATQRPNVHLVAVALLLQDFRRNVVGGATQGALTLTLVIHFGSQPEISKLDLSKQNKDMIVCNQTFHLILLPN